MPTDPAAVAHVDAPLRIGLRMFLGQVWQIVADVRGKVVDQLLGAGVFLVDLVEVARVDQRVDGVDLVAIDELKPLGATVVLVLEEGNLVARLAFDQVLAKVVRQGVVLRAEQRIVQHDRAESQAPQLRREAEFRVHQHDGELRVPLEFVNVFQDGRDSARSDDGRPAGWH